MFGAGALCVDSKTDFFFFDFLSCDDSEALNDFKWWRQVARAVLPRSKQLEDWLLLFLPFRWICWSDRMIDAVANACACDWVSVSACGAVVRRHNHNFIDAQPTLLVPSLVFAFSCIRSQCLQAAVSLVFVLFVQQAKEWQRRWFCAKFARRSRLLRKVLKLTFNSAETSDFCVSFSQTSEIVCCLFVLK